MVKQYIFLLILLVIFLVSPQIIADGKYNINFEGDGTAYIAPCPMRLSGSSKSTENSECRRYFSDFFVSVVGNDIVSCGGEKVENIYTCGVAENGIQCTNCWQRKLEQRIRKCEEKCDKSLMNTPSLDPYYYYECAYLCLSYCGNNQCDGEEGENNETCATECTNPFTLPEKPSYAALKDLIFSNDVLDEDELGDLGREVDERMQLKKKLSHVKDVVNSIRRRRSILNLSEIMPDLDKKEFKPFLKEKLLADKRMLQKKYIGLINRFKIIRRKISIYPRDFFREFVDPLKDIRSQFKEVKNSIKSGNKTQSLENIVLLHKQIDSLNEMSEKIKMKVVSSTEQARMGSIVESSLFNEALTLISQKEQSEKISSSDISHRDISKKVMVFIQKEKVEFEKEGSIKNLNVIGLQIKPRYTGFIYGVRLILSLPKNITHTAQNLNMPEEFSILKDDPIIVWDIESIEEDPPESIEFSLEHEFENAMLDEIEFLAVDASDYAENLVHEENTIPEYDVNTVVDEKLDVEIQNRLIGVVDTVSDEEFDKIAKENDNREENSFSKDNAILDDTTGSDGDLKNKKNTQSNKALIAFGVVGFVFLALAAAIFIEVQKKNVKEIDKSIIKSSSDVVNAQYDVSQSNYYSGQNYYYGQEQQSEQAQDTTGQPQNLQYQR